MYQNKFTTNSSMKFHVPGVINPYSTNRIAEWAHAKTKIAQI